MEYQDFESAMKALEEIVAKLEGGDLPLEQALALFEEGVQIERAMFLELITSEQSRALRHAFFAERAACTLIRDRRTDQAAAMVDHERDDFRGNHLGGTDEITLVFTRLIVGDDNHLALEDVLNRVFYQVKFVSLPRSLASLSCGTHGATG